MGNNEETELSGDPGVVTQDSGIETMFDNTNRSQSFESTANEPLASNASLLDQNRQDQNILFIEDTPSDFENSTCNDETQPIQAPELESQVSGIQTILEETINSQSIMNKSSTSKSTFTRLDCKTQHQD